MKNTYFVSSDNINAKTGAAKFARLLLSKPEMWVNSGFVLDSFTNSNTFTDETVYRKSIRHNFKQFIKSVLGKTTAGKRIRFFGYYINTLSRKPVLQLEPCMKDSPCVILNDFMVAWNFYEKYGTHYHTVFIMHNSGELLSMLHDEMQDKKIGTFLINCEKAILKNATRIVFVSEIARECFIKKYPEYSEKTRTIYIGMDEGSEHMFSNDLPLRFVTVGSVCERKNQILAIKAVDALRDKDIMLTVVGGGPALKECQDYVMAHNLADKVVFTGASNHVGEILEKNDVFLMTSKDEGLPVAAQEAMAAGLPLILTDVGGCRELVESNGTVIHPELDEVIHAMRLFIDHPEKVREYGEKSTELFHKRFSLEKMHSGYIQLIKELE